MRTDTALKLAKQCEGCDDCSVQPKEAMKAGPVRQALHPMQIAAGDKENLVRAGRIPDVKMTSGLPGVTYSPKKEKKKVQDKKPTVTVEDLTTEGNPSEDYWQLLAETRRKALEKTLIENEQLHLKLQKLSEENKKYKELLEEAQGIIDTLNEVINDINTDDSGLVEEVVDVIRRP